MNLLTRSNIIIVILTLCVIILCFNKCGNYPEIPDNSVKPIKIYKVKKDSIRDRIVYKDRWRVKYVEKYRYFKHKVDSVPCPEALNEVLILTDSIIKVDSSLICSLKSELLIDGLIISNQDSLITQDSVKIAGLEKSIKKHKRQKNFITLAALTGWIIAAIK